MSWRLRPSAAPQWVPCPGSLQLMERYPEAEDSPEAIEGTLAHEVARGLAQHGEHVIGEDVTEEMHDGAQLYADAIGDLAGYSHHGFEQEMPCPLIHAENGGTPDFWGLRGHVLRVVDYKFGHGRVEVFENWQLLNYVIAVYEHLRDTGVIPATLEAEQSIRIELVVVQPRYYGPEGRVTVWEFGAGYGLRGYINPLQHAAAKALGDNPPTATGTHCRYCTARHACATLQQAAGYVVDVAAKAVAVDLDGLGVGGELRQLHHAKRLLDARIDGLEEQALAWLKAGKSIPFYQLTQAQAREKWTDDAEVLALGDLFGVDLHAPAKPITPAQARKVIDPSVINQYATRPAGAFKLAPADINQAKKVFRHE